MPAEYVSDCQFRSHDGTGDTFAGDQAGEAGLYDECRREAFYALAPQDFATQYEIGPLYRAGIDGTGQTIGIVDESNLDLSLVDAFRKLYGLPGDNTQVVIDGEDPGVGLSPQR